MTMTINGSSGLIFPDGSGQETGIGRNRIINGDMRIDQRNAGASVTQSTSVAYTVDRWSCYGSVASKFTVQRNAASVTPPVGFTNYLGITSSSAYTVGASEFFFVQQVIEGYNVADLGFGSASASSVTISFWVRSSLTGTFGGTLSNGATNRVYPFTYTISSANTWEQKTVTIAGDTTGTWTTDNTGGLVVNFNMGAGASVSGSAGAWSGSTLRAPTGATSVVGTNGATWYVTGVQLEVGSTATPFERRLYNQELANCQRYYETNFSGVAVPTNNYAYYLNAAVGSNTYAGGVNAAQQILGPIMYNVFKRASPTVTIYSYTSSSTARVSNGWTGADFAANSGVIAVSSYNGFSFYNGTGSNITTGGYSVILNYAASAEL